MRSLVAFAVGACALCAGASHGYFTVAHNAPLAPSQRDPFMVQESTFSDSVNSGGTNFYGLGLAQGFTTSQSYSLDRLTVWGASEYLDSDEPWAQTALSANILGFQAVLMKQNALGAYVTQQSWNIGLGAVSQTATGNYIDGSLSPVFELSMDLTGGFTVGAGTYYLAVGAVLADGDGDSWSWVHGQWDGANPNNLLLATIGDTPTSWGQWSAVPNSTSAAFHLESTIPAPGTLALLAAGAWARGRKRRR